MQPRLTLLVGPADVIVPWRGLPGAGAEPQQSQNMSAVGDKIAQPGARQRFVPQVAVDIFIPQARMRLACHRTKLQRCQLLDRPCDRRLRCRPLGELNAALRALAPRRRQPDQTVVLHAQHRHATGHLLEPTIRFAPAQASQARRDRTACVQDRLSAISARMAASSPALKSRPQ